MRPLFALQAAQDRPGAIEGGIGTHRRPKHQMHGARRVAATQIWMVLLPAVSHHEAKVRKACSLARE